MMMTLDAIALACWWTLQVAIGIVLADFVSGFFHWLEDRYGSPRWPVIGPIIASTIRHHSRPLRILKQPAWRRSAPVLVLVAGGAGLLALVGGFNVITLTALVLLSVANEIHALAHTPTSKNPPFIRRLQRIGIIQSPAHHAIHHRNMKNTHYCILTNWLNPALERIRFWRRIEVLVRIVARQRPRRDPSVRRRQRRTNRRMLAAGYTGR